MSESEFLFQLITSVGVLSGFIGILYGAYSKLIAPLVEKLQTIGSQLDRFSLTLIHVDEKIKPMLEDIDDLQAKVNELEKTIEVIKEQIKNLKGGHHGH